jgi:hypothetical protein
MLFLQICSPTPTESREIEILPISHKGLGFQPKSFNWRPNLEFEESRSSTKMRHQLLQPGCRRDSGTRRGVGRCCRSLGRGVRACTTSWRARGGVNLGGGGNHCGARKGRLGKDARDGRRCINRPGSCGHDIGGEMLPCYSALGTRAYGPDHGRTGGPPRARRAYGAATGRHVARGLQCTARRGPTWERSTSRVVCGLGRRWPWARTPRRRGRVGVCGHHSTTQLTQSKLEIKHVFKQQTFTSHALTRTILSRLIRGRQTKNLY